MTPPRRPPGTSALAATGLRSRAREHPDAALLGRSGGASSARALFGELGGGLAAVRLAGALPRLLTAPRGEGHPVVDIPGWKAPELTGAPLRAYLRLLGHDARGWGFGTNTGHPRRDVERLARRVLALADDSGRAVSLVGWSLGGVIARDVARQHPDAVRRVITYGTPVPRRLDARTPLRVPLTVVFSRRDGIVPWPACIDRSSTCVEHVEVSSTHLGMGLDPDVWELVAHRLAEPAP